MTLLSFELGALYFELRTWFDVDATKYEAQSTKNKALTSKIPKSQIRNSTFPGSESIP
jgi:hypothetical protein